MVLIRGLGHYIFFDKLRDAAVIVEGIEITRYVYSGDTFIRESQCFLECIQNLYVSLTIQHTVFQFDQRSAGINDGGLRSLRYRSDLLSIPEHIKDILE